MSSALPQGNRSIWQRFKWTIIGVISVLISIAIVVVVLVLVVIPKSASLGTAYVRQEWKDGLIIKPNLTRTPKGLGSFDDNSRPNSNTPAIKDVFQYGESKIRGVNLGGWLVPEPFIVPSLFKPYVESNVVDEWTLCEALGKKKCTEVLTKHYESFLTEQEIKRIADAGLNHVRIPIGYWSIETTEDEPYVYGAWEYLLRGIQWCRKYGLRVMIDFHAAPGSQNGFNHSGRSGSANFLSRTNPNSKKDAERLAKIIVKVAGFFAYPEWNKIVTQIGVLNEPNVKDLKNQFQVAGFYTEVYNTVRNLTGDTEKSPIMVFSDGLVGLEKWELTMPKDKFNRVALDTHKYMMFDNKLMSKSMDELIQFPCDNWAPEFSQSMDTFGWTMSSEFSVATNDCGTWLNGIDAGARYDGSFQNSQPACPDCSCDQKNDYKQFSSEYKEQLLKLAEFQMSTFELGIGWYFWNFKTEDHANPHWDYFLGLDQGWLPADANSRTHTCPPPSPKLEQNSNSDQSSNLEKSPNMEQMPNIEQSSDMQQPSNIEQTQPAN